MHLPRLAVSAALAGILLAPAAQADNFLPNIRLAQLFNRAPSPPADVDDEPPARNGPSNSELVVRLDRLERLNRELTGQIEQLQFQLRRLEEQVRSQPVPSRRPPMARPRPPSPAACAAATPSIRSRTRPRPARRASSARRSRARRCSRASAARCRQAAIPARRRTR